MTEPRPPPPTDDVLPTPAIDATEAVVVDFSSSRTDPDTPASRHLTLDDALARMAEAEDTLRAIGAGEIDAFVVSEGGGERRVFTLSTADRPYRMFVENMREGAATVSAAGLILYANRRLAELLACPRDSIVGSHLSRFMADPTPVGLAADTGAGGIGATVELELLDGTGATLPVLVGLSPLEVDGEQLTCLTFTDLSAQKSQEREIARLGLAQAERLADLQVAQAELTLQATHDALTGLPNRALLVDRIDQALTHSTRRGQCTAVLFVDLDRFKQVNDTQGHAAGNVVLRRVADQLVALLGPLNTVARIGGDEFVILLPDLAGTDEAMTIASLVVAELRRRPAADAGEPVTASVGVAASFRGRGTAELLLHEADTAMYLAKSLGGARAERYDAALGLEIDERSAAQRMLQSALAAGRVIAHYQPIVELAAGRVTAFEALARVSQPDGALLDPAAFIPIAESSGLVVPLGSTVLRRACGAASTWSPPDSTVPVSVAVNVSPRQFEPGDLTMVIREALHDSGLDPTRLHLELTETAIIDLHPAILQQLGHIRDLGVQIGLDDFGTGYASLTHLRRLPLTFVKIDRSFVSGLRTDREDERIVAAVVDLAANLGLRSIAEGVETTGQLERLRAMGCDQAQGYLFARPMPAADVPAAIRQPAW